MSVLRLKGILVALCDGPLYEMTDLESAQEMCIEELEKCTYNPDRMRMLYNVRNAKTLELLQRYIYNAMFKHNGLGAK